MEEEEKAKKEWSECQADQSHHRHHKQQRSLSSCFSNGLWNSPIAQQYIDLFHQKLCPWDIGFISITSTSWRKIRRDKQQLGFIYAVSHGFCSASVLLLGSLPVSIWLSYSSIVSVFGIYRGSQCRPCFVSYNPSLPKPWSPESRFYRFLLNSLLRRRLLLAMMLSSSIPQSYMKFSTIDMSLLRSLDGVLHRLSGWQRIWKSEYLPVHAQLEIIDVYW